MLQSQSPSEAETWRLASECSPACTLGIKNGQGKSGSNKVELGSLGHSRSMRRRVKSSLVATERQVQVQCDEVTAAGGDLPLIKLSGGYTRTS